MQYRYAYQQTEAKPLYRGIQVVWYLINIIEIILLFRFVLRLVGANTAAPFTQLVYGLAHPFIAPFQFTVPSYTTGMGVFDWNTLIAMIVYWVIGSLISHLLVLGRPLRDDEAAQKLSQHENI